MNTWGKVMCPHDPEVGDSFLKEPSSGGWWRETREAEPVDRSQVQVMLLTSWDAEVQVGDPAPGQQRAPGASQHEWETFYFYLSHSIVK